MTALRSAVQISLAVIVSLSVTGCANFSTGHKLDEKNVGKIRNHTTTKSEILGLLGEPQSKSTGGGKETWTYIFVESKMHMNPLTYIPVLGPFIYIFTNTKSTDQHQALSLEFSNNVVVKCDLTTSTGQSTSNFIGGSNGTSENAQVVCGVDEAPTASALAK